MRSDSDLDDFSHLPQVEGESDSTSAAEGRPPATAVASSSAKPPAIRRVVIPSARPSAAPPQAVAEAPPPAPAEEPAPASPAKKKIRLRLPVTAPAAKAASAPAEPENEATADQTETAPSTDSQPEEQPSTRAEITSEKKEEQPEAKDTAGKKGSSDRVRLKPAEKAAEAKPGKGEDEPESDGAKKEPSDDAEEKEGGEITILVHTAHGEEGPLTAKDKFWRTWEKIGGRSLTLSVGLHLFLLLIAGLIVFNYARDERVDFMPGGGTHQGNAASQALEQTVTRKRTPWMNRKLPMQRIAVEKSMSDIRLPEASPDLLDLPMTKDFLNSGSMGSMGFGSAGAGGGFGNGIGTGGKSGVTFRPITMFGKQINAKRIAVVLDVSRSMTPYLERVVNELDRVAQGSTVVLYYGCGLLRPDGRLDETVLRTQNRDFERFWRIWQGDGMLGFSGQDLKKISFPPGEPIPLPDLFRFLAKRQNTYYLDYNGMDFAWTALLCNEVRNADALYWFADFEDQVNDRQMKTLAENMRLRKQRLFIHPQIHGISFKDVEEKIVKVTGGEVVEPRERLQRNSN